MKKLKLQDVLSYGSIILAVVAIVIGGISLVQTNRLSNDLDTIQQNNRSQHDIAQSQPNEDEPDNDDTEEASSLDLSLDDDGITLRGRVSIGDNGELKPGIYKITAVEASDSWARLYIYDQDGERIEVINFNSDDGESEIPSYVLRDGYELDISNVSLHFTKLD